MIVTNSPAFANNFLNCTGSLDLEENLKKIPITTKNDLINSGETNIDHLLSVCSVMSETSGTTGNTLFTPRIRSDFEWNINNHCRAYDKWLQPGYDRVMILHPGIMSPFVEATSHALYRLGIGFLRVYPIENVCSYERIYKILNKYKITTIMSTPTLVYNLFQNIGREKYGRFNIEKILLTGEIITENSIHNLSNISLNANNALVVPFVYGSSESAVVMSGNEDNTYSLYENDFIYEFVQPNSGQHINDSDEYGKLIITWLQPGALPILRYDTGDIFKIESRDKDIRVKCIGRGSDIDNVIDKYNYENAIYAINCDVYDFNISHSKYYINISVEIGDTFTNIDSLKNEVIQIVDKHNPNNLPKKINIISIYDSNTSYLKPKKHRIMYE